MAEQPAPRYVTICIPPPPGADLPPLERAQYDMLALLREIRDCMCDMRPQGTVLGFTQSVTNDPSDAVQSFDFFPKMFDLEITNDGPNPVEYRIPDNAGASWIELDSSETDSTNASHGVLASIGVRLRDIGDTASSVRIRGLY